jgi:hypothetical protein
MTEPSNPAIACDLSALTARERTMRAELAARIRSLATQLVELEDGYALRLASEPEVARHALEWMLLESRCCPFLRMELVVEAERGPLWVRLRGAAGVKEFLKAAGLGVTQPGRSCGC